MNEWMYLVYPRKDLITFSIKDYWNRSVSLSLPFRNLNHPICLSDYLDNNRYAWQREANYPWFRSNMKLIPFFFSVAPLKMLSSPTCSFRLTMSQFSIPKHPRLGRISWKYEIWSEASNLESHLLHWLMIGEAVNFFGQMRCKSQTVQCAYPTQYSVWLVELDIREARPSLQFDGACNTSWWGPSTGSPFWIYDRHMLRPIC